MYKKSYLLLLSSIKGFKVLISAIACGINVRKVVISKDTKVLNDYSKEIIDLCRQNSLEYSINIKDFEIDNEDIVVAVSWKWIINCPLNQLLVFHDSILPKYRGFAPLANMLINGEKKIGVTALFGSKKYDTGKIIFQKSVKINYPIKINDAISVLSEIYEELSKIIFLSEFNYLIDNAQEQNEDLATYSIWRDEEDYYIDWSQSSEEIQRFVNAVGFPYQGARTLLGDSEIFIDEVVIIKDLKLTNRHFGKVIFLEDNKPVVICGRGLLRIDNARIKNNNGYKKLIPLEKFRIRFG